MSKPIIISRRQAIKSLGKALFVTGLGSALPLPVWAKSITKSQLASISPAPKTFNLEIGPLSQKIDGKKGKFTAINGTVPGPLLRFKEGETVTLNVTNNLKVDTSLHWHGLIVPANMDGVPKISFPGIKPGETFTYKYTLRQSGTYWYHSHSRFQEQTGAYGPIIIDPIKTDEIPYDREFVILLSDWSFENPETIFRNLKLMGDYYNHQRQTVGDFVSEASKEGFLKTLKNRMMWGKMRMSPVDLADVTGSTYTFLMNGQSPDMNWTELFAPGERIKLKFINGSAMSTFDVRIPGLDMEIIAADGQNIKPVKTHEFRMGTAETYDAIIEPKENQAYTIFAEAMDRSGFARGTLTPKIGLKAEIPDGRKRAVRQIHDMGHDMKMDQMDMSKEVDHSNMDHSKMGHDMGSTTMETPEAKNPNLPSRSNTNVAMLAMNPVSKLNEPGIGLGTDGWKVLTYAELEARTPSPHPAQADRDMTINITANMERYMFSLDGKKLSEQDGPYEFKHNERLRLYLINHTMMEHPIHLHGMWMELENGQKNNPFKHTINVKPGEKLSVLITPIEKGDWAFHCHFLYHMAAGMFQIVRVS